MIGAVGGVDCWAQSVTTELMMKSAIKKQGANPERTGICQLVSDT